MDLYNKVMRHIHTYIRSIISDAFQIIRRLLFNNMDRIAIIIPVYNVTTFLEEALKSVVRQNYSHKEVIIIDDGSSEEAAAEIKRICHLFPGVTLLHQQHVGTASAREKGVSYTRAELILFLDADDILQPGALKYLAAALRKKPDAIAAYANILYCDEHGKVIGKHHIPDVSGKQVLYALLEGKDHFCNGSICIRRQPLIKLLPHNHTIRFAEDWVLWCHLALSGDIIFAGDRVVLFYRYHNANVSKEIPDNASLFFAAHDTIFMNRNFINAIGEEKIRILREKCFSRIHLYLARTYTKQNNIEKAKHHMEKVTTTLSRIHFIQ